MSEEMKKLVIDGTEFEVVDAAGRDRITVLENTTPSGGGLSITEKNLILQLFGKAAYSENDAGTAYTALSNLWSGSYHSVAWEGSGYTKSNSDVAIEDGGSFTSTITANNGKTIESVTVLMGGETVQGAYSSGTITIPNVTGDIVITVTTAQMAVSSISAVYTQSGTVYDTDSLNSLKPNLVVTATFPDQSTAVIPAADYTLSGTLLAGTSTITVSYSSKTASFNVTVTHATPDTSPVITDYDKYINTGGSISSSEGCCCTDYYNMLGSSITLYCPFTEDSAPRSNPNFASYMDTTKTHYWNGYAASNPLVKDISAAANDSNKLRFTLFTSGISDCYCYDTSSGDIYFAGEDSPYYGMENISEAD